MLLDVVERRQPCSVVTISSELPGVDRHKLYSRMSTLCRLGRLEVRGREPRPDGIGMLSLYGIARGRVTPTVARADDRPDPAAVAAAEVYWSRSLLAIGTAPFKTATTRELAQLREMRPHGTTTECPEGNERRG